MNSQPVKNVVTPGAIAAAIILLSVCLPFNAITAIGFTTVAGILGIAALEYGPGVKRWLNRKA